MLDSLMVFLARDFFFVVLLLAAAFFVWWFYRRRSLPGVLRELGYVAAGSLFIGAVSLLIAKVASQLIISPRPFTQPGSAPAMIAGSLDNGFPSDHTLLLAAVAAIVCLVNLRLSLIFWVLALVVGLARVYVGVHHMVDIAGSLAIVAIAYGLFLLLLRLVQSRGALKGMPRR
ncbi:MAG: phosphatase PAP2 family protein [Chloroflexota bacterium]|nr:phosphatase PAP2 family protein [Chloroflexota bacterium]